MRFDGILMAVAVLVLFLSLAIPSMGVDIRREIIKGAVLIFFLYAVLDRVRLRGYTSEAWGAALLGIAFVVACIGILIFCIYRATQNPDVIFLTRWKWWAWF